MVCLEAEYSLPATGWWQAKSIIVVNKIICLILFIIFSFRRLVLLQKDSYI